MLLAARFLVHAHNAFGTYCTTRKFPRVPLRNDDRLTSTIIAPSFLSLAGQTNLIYIINAHYNPALDPDDFIIRKPTLPLVPTQSGAESALTTWSHAHFTAVDAGPEN
jgi:hypothetical protein